MKQGLDLKQIEQVVREEITLKDDIVAQSSSLKFGVETDNTPKMIIEDKVFNASDLMVNQIANKLSVPKKYLDRMIQDAPELAESNVNHWLQNEPRPYMVRTLGDNARAFLSDRYEIIDNWDVLTAILPALKPFKDRDDLEFEQSHVTDRHLYLRLTVPSMTKDVGVKKKGDIICFGIQVKNSEVGLGSVEVSPFVKRLVCTNGMVADRYGHRKRHLGRSQWDGVDKSVLRQETIRQGNKAWIMTVQDEVQGMFNGTTFEQIADEFTLAQETEPVQRPAKAIEHIVKEYDFLGFEGESILENLLTDGDKTKYGMANAITRTATDSNTADRSMELESIGYKFLTMPNREWSNIATIS